MPVDVFQHDDGVVDDEAHGDGQRHEREIVQRIADDIHQRCCAEQRQRHGDAGDDRRPEVAQEKEDDHHDKRAGQQQGEFDISDRRLDRRRAVDDRVDADGGRHGVQDLRQHILYLLDRIDDVGAGLLEHLQDDAGMVVLPGEHLRVFRSVNRGSDIADAHRRAVPVGNNDVVPRRGGHELIIVVDGEIVQCATDRALG